MNPAAYLQFVLALLFVLALIGAAAALARRCGLAPAVRPDRLPRRLAVVESLAIDGKRRLVLLRRDGIEHLVLLAPSADVVVESAIGAVEPSAAAEVGHAG